MFELLIMIGEDSKKHICTPGERLQINERFHYSSLENNSKNLESSQQPGDKLKDKLHGKEKCKQRCVRKFHTFTTSTESVFLSRETLVALNGINGANYKEGQPETRSAVLRFYFETFEYNLKHIYTKGLIDVLGKKYT